ncbi:MAG: RNA-binding domain-containing protein [Candidatus Bathyarchaeia archaeon]
MKYPTKVLSIEITTIIHATESIERVIQALENIFPESFKEKLFYSKQRLTGHYGNPITMLKTKIKKEAFADAFIRNLSEKMSKEDRSKLLLEFEKHLDNEGNLYIRIDKQEAFLGRIALKQADPIRIKIKFNTVSSILEACKEIGLI